MFSLFHCCDGGGGGGGGRAAVGIVRAGKNKGRKEKLLDIAPPLLHTFLSSSSLAARSARALYTDTHFRSRSRRPTGVAGSLFFIYRTRYLQLWVCSKNPNVGIAGNSTDSRAAEGERKSSLIF